MMKNINELFDLMTKPTQRLVDDMKKIDGDILILGAGGKVGSTVAITAKRAMDAAGLKHRVIAASLFDYENSPVLMKNAGVEVIEADLFNPEQLRGLPQVENVIYMVGRKFGTTGNQSLTWAINVMLPAFLAQNFSKSRIVAYSTGNVYGLRPVTGGGALEDDELEPVGEYAQTCVGRERVLEYYSRKNGTPMLMFRLNYAIDMRYGVLHDIASKVYAGKEVDISAGVFNCIWQGDVAEYTLRCLLHCKTPPNIINITGPETVSVKWAAEEFGRIFGKEVRFTGEAKDTALFSNTAKQNTLLGYPNVSLGQMMLWTAEWIQRGGETITAPTHFEEREGRY